MDNFNEFAVIESTDYIVLAIINYYNYYFLGWLNPKLSGPRMNLGTGRLFSVAWWTVIIF